MAKPDKVQSNKAGKHRIRPRAGEWGFLIRGKGKAQGQNVNNK